MAYFCSSRMQKRHILWWLIFLMVVCNTLVTLNIDIAIVSMVNFQETTENSNQTSPVICTNTTFFLRNFLNGVDEVKTSVHSKGGYDWSKQEQATVLSGYYWLNYISILPAGILAQKYGSKRVVGISQGLASIMSSLIPILGGYGYLVVAWIRAAQGVLSFMSVPAGMYTILGNWSPPQERGIFGSSIAVGSGFGYAVGNFCFGYVAEYIHWHYIFHVTSVCGAIWLVLWYFLIYDEPQNHRSISSKERKYIEDSLQEFAVTQKESIPWKNIITSIPVIVCILATNAAMWYFVMMATYLPVYLKSMYGLNSEEIGIITSVPPLIACGITLIVGYMVDDLIKKQILKLDVARKCCCFIGCIVSSLVLFVMAFTKCDINLVIVCVLLSFCLRGISMFGTFVGIIDMSPKFCGILDGISGTTQSIITFVFASMISHLTGMMETENLWRFVFVFTGTFVIAMNLLYIIFGTSKVQPWNFDDPTEEKN